MKNDETAATILALPDGVKLRCEGHGEFSQEVRVDFETTVLIALAESWQQQNAMLEAAEGIAFGDSNHNYITLCGEDDRWRSVYEMATVQYGIQPAKYLHPGYESAPEAYAALKEKTDERTT